MNTVLRVGGLQFMIFVDDHAPAHVHVYGGSGMAKINLAGPDDQPWLEWSKGMNLAERHPCLRATGEAQTFLLEKWRELHGRTN